jgi:hypothetical protein
MSRTGSGVSVIPAKKGGFATYVESAAHSYRSPSAIGSARQRASPSKTDAYAVRNSSPSTASAMAARTSSADGQMSARKTGAPSSAMPSGSGERVGHHERRRRQVARAGERVNPALEVAVPRQHRDRRQLALLDLARDGGVERPGVADAGRAAVPGQREAEGRERGRQAGPLEVGRHGPRSGRERRLDRRVDMEPAGDGVRGQQPGADHHGGVRGVRARRDRGDDDGAGANLAGAGRGRPQRRELAREGGVEARAGLRHGDPVLRTLGPGKARLDRREVQVDHNVEVGFGAGEAPEALGPRVALHELDEVGAPAGQAQVRKRLVVDREDRGRGPELGAHVADRRAVGERQAGEPVARELHERSDHAQAAQALRDGQDEVGGGRAARERAAQPDTDDPRHRLVERLAQQDRLGLDAAHAVAQHAQRIDHRGVGVGPDQGVRVRERPAVDVGDGHDAGKELEVDLVDDARARRNDAEPGEGALRPA